MQHGLVYSQCVCVCLYVLRIHTYLHPIAMATDSILVGNKSHARRIISDVTKERSRGFQWKKHTIVVYLP